MQRKHGRTESTPLTSSHGRPPFRQNPPLSNPSKTNISTPSRFSRATGHAERLLFEIKIQYYPTRHHAINIRPSMRAFVRTTPLPKLCAPINPDLRRQIYVFEEKSSLEIPRNSRKNFGVDFWYKRDDTLLEIIPYSFVKYFFLISSFQRWFRIYDFIGRIRRFIST